MITYLRCVVLKSVCLAFLFLVQAVASLNGLGKSRHLMRQCFVRMCVFSRVCACGRLCAHLCLCAHVHVSWRTTNNLGAKLKNLLGERLLSNRTWPIYICFHAPSKFKSIKLPFARMLPALLVPSRMTQHWHKRGRSHNDARDLCDNSCLALSAFRSSLEAVSRLVAGTGGKQCHSTTSTDCF